PVAGRSYEIQQVLKDMYHMDTHVVILGHIQRGGSPASNDRFIASQMGNMSVEALLAGEFPKVTVVQNGKVLLTDLINCTTKADHNFTEYQTLAQTLSI
ncbi:MAG: 6-phosphofructokinase, partial [Bacteriovoracia bacterium]